MNALKWRTAEELNAVFHAAKEGAMVKGILLAGVGEKTFIAGADIAELSAIDGDKAGEFTGKRHGSIGLSKRSKDRLLPTQHVYRQLARRIVQWNLPGRVSGHALVPLLERSKTSDRITRRLRKCQVLEDCTILFRTRIRSRSE